MRGKGRGEGVGTTAGRVRVVGGEGGDGGDVRNGSDHGSLQAQAHLQLTLKERRPAMKRDGFAAAKVAASSLP